MGRTLSSFLCRLFGGAPPGTGFTGGQYGSCLCLDLGCIWPEHICGILWQKKLNKIPMF